jgi:hypothetical protein
MFIQTDLDFFKKRSSEIKLIEIQIEQLKKGASYINLVSPAIIDNGIMKTDEQSRKYYVSLFEESLEFNSVVKFVPASGAASRMFKDMYACLNELKNSKENQETILNNYSKVKEVVDEIKKFAFYFDLCNLLSKKNLSVEKLISEKDYLTLIQNIIDTNGLNYGSLPKALLNFHDYHAFQRKAVEEHLVEGAEYSFNHNGIVKIHFTISNEHEEFFKTHLDKVLSDYENKFNVKYEIAWSFQHQSTDTIAVDIENNIFRDENNNPLFRPAGHGALINNLNELSEDFIFIKNIDNITTDKLRTTTIEYKKVIAGILIDTQTKIHGNIEILIHDNCIESDINEIANFCNTLHIALPENFENLSFKEKKDTLFQKLNRPIRVCGMVKNEGEPGGGPFFIKNQKNAISLQIIEGAQIDMNNKEQVEILKNSTHFNPVDIVAGITDYKGNKFNLLNFIDHDTYMISEKSKDGKKLKALELPGLWNGAMAEWITIFVEVPLNTFSPVKEINDLLRPQHIV